MEKETDTLIQSTLIIAWEEGIIIASSQTQSCATNFVQTEGERERERERKRKRGKRTEALTRSLAGLIDGRVAMFIIRARRFRFTVQRSGHDSPRIDLLSITVEKFHRPAAATAWSGSETRVVTTALITVSRNRSSLLSVVRAIDASTLSPRGNAREKMCDFMGVVPLRSSILISVLSVPPRADATCYRTF